MAEQTDYDHWWLINLRTGEVVLWIVDGGIDGQSPVDLDDLDLVNIDPLPSYIWYQDVADFAERVSDGVTGRRLTRAIQGEGAFRRIKSELHEGYPDLLQTWYTFRAVRASRWTVEWLVDNSLVDDDARDRFMTEHPDPEIP